MGGAGFPAYHLPGFQSSRAGGELQLLVAAAAAASGALEKYVYHTCRWMNSQSEGTKLS